MMMVALTLLLLLLLWACPTLALQLSQSATRTTRRSWLVNAGTAAMVVLPSGLPSAALATEAADDLDAKVAAKEAVRVEIGKGITFLRTQLDAQDYEAIMDFTKTYDQILRKGYMGKAKKLMSTNGDVLTGLTNAVTFDLIGINRNVRKGQVNPEQAAKYIQELQDDVEKFLALD
jgi:hypothetical protein